MSTRKIPVLTETGSEYASVKIRRSSSEYADITIARRSEGESVMITVDRSEALAIAKPLVKTMHEPYENED